MRTSIRAALMILCALSGCHRRAAPPEPPAPPSPSPSGQVVIAPGGGLGGTQVQTDGRNVWPPSGPGCEQLVACCQQAASGAMDVTLFCQMSVATPPVDCARALGEVRNYLSERHMPTAAACQGGSPQPPPPPPPLPTPPPPPPNANPQDAPLACAQDADCPRLACGPCVSGAPVTAFITRINCVRNPCPGAVAVCRNGACVVR